MPSIPTATLSTLWSKTPKANADFVALTYGALVGELVRDLETCDAIQTQLDQAGHGIGVRCMDELLALLVQQQQHNADFANFQDTAELISAGLRLFWGVSADVTVTDGSYTLVLTDNPLTSFVELPTEYKDLEYSQLFCGMVRGMLETIQYDCAVQMVHNTLAGKGTRIQVTLNQVVAAGAGDDYHEE